jgi:hypothetical protein
VTTIHKRNVGDEQPGDKFECCGCVKVFERAQVEALEDGWYCLKCLKAGNYDSFASQALVQQAIRTLKARAS